VADALITWRKAFEIGIAEVDFEHRKLIDLINQVYAETDAAVMDVERLLGEIYSGIASHFALEEKDMSDIGWWELEAHKEDHEALLDDLRDIMEDAVDAGEIDAAALGVRLSSWFGGHFQSFDARLHQAMR
jgi:hemerythrin